MEAPHEYKAAILAAFPDLASASFEVLGAGWDSLALAVDSRLIFKFPRHERAAQSLRREAALLGYLQPRLSISVPAPVLIETPFLFSRHESIPGEHIVTAQYLALPEAAREAMAGKLAQFYAELHALPQADFAALGAAPIGAWLSPGEILDKSRPHLSGDIAEFLEATTAAWQALPPDPFGTVFGFFDGHGWNMAFDHERQVLNGIYDFGDSGFGPLSQEFIYSDLIDPDLTDRIIAQYNSLTGRAVDPARVHLLTGVHRLTEFAELANDPEHAPDMRAALEYWVRR
jgi:aminoglycoside phosphotransferase (APT) family kinase protein